MSNPHSTRQWLLAEKPTDLPVLEGPSQTFKLHTRELPALQDDQVLVQVLYLSNDPAQRGWISRDINPERLYTVPVKLNTPMHARALCKVLESKSSNIKKGTDVLAAPGWTEYAVLDTKAVQPAPDLPGGLNITHYLGALGGTGLTAYYGLKVVAEAEASDRVVVSGAAGATGSMVVQIAKKLIGCKRVIGIAGSDEKCRWVESLGADICLNYKKSSFKEDLVKETEGFIDVYFDNVGGEILDLMFTRMAKGGRIAACGEISNYNKSASKREGLKNWFEVISMRIQIRGFIVTDYLSKRGEVLDIFRKAIEDGKLDIGVESEQVIPAKFEDIPKVWMKLFEGSNTGKLITAVQE
jgi:NADPH-dependent curcumin reductase CurA